MTLSKQYPPGQGECEECPAGSYCAPGEDIEECPPGRYCPSGTGVCCIYLGIICFLPVLILF